MDYNKNRLLEILISNIKEQLQIDVRVYENTKQSAIEAPSRMESRYDSSKSELSRVANSLIDKIQKTKMGLSLLERFEFYNDKENIVTGNIVKLKEESNGIIDYFILPYGGGNKITINSGGEVLVITPASPIGREIIGKRIGNEVILSLRNINKKYKILEKL